ncbi:NAD(P)/FAD-dependent oxidoreductase [Mucilaginibacter sp. L3T2-6]|uniref:NAD(P)/FAD-dependent oxidoreductase n=1 Tax=Mucilaginibacter sp. L3T2-6 TaxID=3062491 RepID=UPI002674457B|nr:NAD(P)/FAD-dependent oxidoreductase [Mucilaginibacter sp. L3T2-6]MDO3644899.1 NAD(P)/FAD-dependent oxidoreductase [Mucilaginibacter sp. L3T2-6]MDV6217350.1 NAD(P)/FAD-dependent oxidoreductase [Mucilaginibacter sp. L3T2-6]
MKTQQKFDVIIVGGSYSGLAAGMALGRALRRVLIIDSGKPCNAQTPHSHNFLTQDGQPPAAIAALGKSQVKKYGTVSFLDGMALKANATDGGFEVKIATGETFRSKKLIFATGIRDMLPKIDGLAECWGISVLHCPFCHGYEVRDKKTGIIGNGNHGFELAGLISNWTKDLSIFTNGPVEFTGQQIAQLAARHIDIIEIPIAKLEHTGGNISSILLEDRTRLPLTAAYIHSPFRQACPIPELLGCALTEDGYIQADAAQLTSVPGAFACGDSASRVRTVANAVAAGTTAGIMATRQLIAEEF